MKNSVKIAYWDTEQQGRTPSIFGQIKGTPTIKFLIPNGKKNKKGSYKKKIARDYQGEREFKPMMEFAESNMPSSVVRINGMKDLEKFLTKAAEYGLPAILSFSKTSSHVVKHMSTEYRRRALVGEVKGTSNNKAVMKEYDVKDLPAVLALTTTGSTKRLKKKPTFNRLNMFIKDHALKEPVFGTFAKRLEKQEKEAKKKMGDSKPQQDREEL